MTQAISRRQLVRRIANRSELQALAVTLLLWVIFGLINPNLFKIPSILNIIRASTVIAIGSIGAGVVIIGGDYDLSVGSMLALQATILASLATDGLINGIWASFALVVAIGIVLGTVNGLLVSLGRLPSIIATIGTMFLFRGFTLIVAGGQWFSDLPRWLVAVGQSRIVGIPVPLITLILVALVAWYVISKTRFGLRVYAIGDNPRAAILKGLNIHVIKIWTFVISGVLVGIAALVLAGQYGYVQTDIGYDYVLSTVAACIVGGVDPFGGRGTVIQPVIGALLIGVMSIGLVAVNVPPQWYQAVLGMLILASLTRDMALRRSHIQVS